MTAKMKKSPTTEFKREVGRKQLARAFGAGAAFLLFLQASAGLYVYWPVSDFYMLLGYVTISIAFIMAVALGSFASAYAFMKVFNK